MIISAVLFDFDGTLTRPHAIDFSMIRKELGCAAGEPLLEYIDGLTKADERAHAGRVLDRHEMQAAAQAVPNLYAEETVKELRRVGVPVAILTRNSEAAVQRSLQNFNGIQEADFDVVVTRDHAFPPKPDPHGIQHVAEQLNIPVTELLCVGDYVFDIQSANRAGSPSAFLTNGTVSPKDLGAVPDVVIDDLRGIVDLVRLHRRLAPGKLPNDLLASFLSELATNSPDLVVKPGVGEDCAVVKTSDAGWLALKSDPITFATDEIGFYTVVVNANDLAVAGARPRWLLTTLLMPPGVCGADVRQVMRQLHDAAQRWDITLCGGHTEITDSVTRPVVCGHLVGELRPEERVDKRNARPGNKLLLTKRVAVEGTAVIAREMPERLRKAGVAEELIEDARRFLESPGISILPEARAAVETGGVSAMHDVTEGGLVTAIDELSAAAGYGLRVDLARVPIYKETDVLCRTLDLDPLGLIGSGSLLIVCQSEREERVISAIREIGVEVTCIGEVMDMPPGVRAERSGQPVQWPQFEVDEIARFFTL